MLQVLRELGEVSRHRGASGMVRVGADGVDEGDRLAVDGVVDESMRQRRHPRRQAARDQSVERRPVAHEPRGDAVGGQVDRAAVRVGFDQLLEPRADRAAPVRCDEVLARERLDHVLHVVVAQCRQHAASHRGALRRDALGVRRLGEPGAQPGGDLGGLELGADHRRGQEVGLDELAERSADLVLPRRDDRGVGDRQAERPAEQRGDGEPIRQRAHHAALAGGAQVREGRDPLLADESHDEQHCGGQQRADRDGLHAAQRTAAPLIGGREQLGRGARHGAILARRTWSTAEYSDCVIEDIQKRALHRTRILEGQLRGLGRMIENEDYCMDIITQSRAIQRSLESLNRLLLENHLRTHVTHMFETGGDDREQAVGELLRAFDFDGR